MIQIFNTMSGKIENFVPIEENKVRMYVCGPTVYNLIHIGNARPMIFFDTVRRYFMYSGYEVNYVSNFTDVDDKIIKAANEENVDASVISQRYIEECKKDMKAMNILPATKHPLATEEIEGMIAMIEELIAGGHAYVAKDGTVYFRTRSFEGYGKLSHKNLDDLRSGERALKVSGEEQKEDPLDFVLWKPKKEGEPFWKSPWCDGRPGWHIECSVMSKRYLGEEIDIHGGGEDLVFPHHENEIAQSESCSHHLFARYWMHNAFLNIDNRKMSKSLGNFFTVRDILQKYDPQVLRLFMLSAHYRSPLNFSDKLMESAKASYARVVNCVSNLNFALEKEDRQEELFEEEGLGKAKAGEYEQAYRRVMDDDFNTADAISVVFELVRLANTTVNENSSRAYIRLLKEKIVQLCDVLGLIAERKTEKAQLEISEEEIEEKIAERTKAKKEKDFALADAIREELLSKGIVLEDTREGVKWTVKS